MIILRPVHRAALLIVDVQVGVMVRVWNECEVVRNIALAVERAREHGVPVIWIQHETEDLPRGSSAWQLVPELAPLPSERRIAKRFPSSFEETSLKDVLAEVNASHLVLAGAQTNWCIRATAYAALERGYDLTLLADAHTTESIELGDERRVEAADMVADLNLTMKWLRYPGRSNGIAKAGEIDFTLLGSHG